MITLLSFLLQSSKIKNKSYIIFGRKSVIFCIKLNMALKALLSCGIENSFFKRGLIWIPVDENKFALMHLIMIDELKIEHTISEFVVGQ